MKNEKIEYLFQNLKNGDVCSNYYKKWYYLFARLIKVVTGQEISHCMGIFDVKRLPDKLSFKIGESVIIGGKRVVDYEIQIYDNNIRYFSNIDKSPELRFNKKGVNFYYSKNKKKLTAAQNKELSNFWNEKEKYEFDELFYTNNTFFKFFGKKSKKYDGNCSTAVAESLRRVGINIEDEAPTPAELVKCEFLEQIVKIIK